MPSDRITRLAPRPRAVAFGGSTLPVREATLSDVADLQAWIDARQPDPTAGLAGRLEGLDGAERDRVLFDAYDAADDAPTVDDDAGRSLLFGTAAGLAHFASVALKLGPDEAVAALAEATPEEFSALRRAFWGSDPAREVFALFGFPVSAVRGEPLSWGEAVDEVAREHGWTYSYVYSLTLSEFRNALRRGKPVPSGFEQIPPSHHAEVHGRIVKARYGDVDPGVSSVEDTSGAEDDGGWVYPATSPERVGDSSDGGTP